MSHVSRRAVLMGLTGAVFGTRSVVAQTRLVSKARPLARDAVMHDWSAFLGPTHNAVSSETRLSRKSPPSLVWEFSKGTGYGSPAMFLHRLRGEEIVECLHAETGATHWQFRYPTDFEDRYGYNDGPRSSPVIDGGRVYTVGAQGQLHCLDLAGGRVIWKRDIDKEYRVPQDFFGRSYGQFLCLGELGHLLWMDLTPKGYKEVSRARLFVARESWALPVLSRGLLYVVQNTRDFVTGARPRMLCYDLRA